MAKKIPFLLFAFFPIMAFTQSDCLDENGDCSLIGSMEFHVDIAVECGDTITLSPTDELCNTWIIPTSFNSFFGIAEDTATAYIVVENCTSDTIIVEGITNTTDGTNMASCNTTIVYHFVPLIDTIQEEIPCSEFIELDETYELLQGQCGCDSLLIEYVTDFSNCVDCGEQCIYITGTTTITGGDTEGADVIVTYSLNGQTLTAGHGDWTGEVEQLECFSAEDDLEIIEVQALVPAGASGSASASAWIITNPGVMDTTYLFNQTCQESQTGTFEEILLSASGCDSIVMTQVDLYPEIEVLVENQHACIGETVILFADAPAAVSYLWNTGETDLAVEISEPGIYTVAVTDANNCVTTAEGLASFSDIDIVLSASVAEEFLLSESPLEVWEGSAVELRGDVYGTPFSYEFIWNGGPEIGDTTFNHTALQTADVTLAVIDSVACIKSSTITVNVRPTKVFIPTAFSPNGDQMNDVFNIYTSPNVEEARLQIFSRSGNKVFDEYLIPEDDSSSIEWSTWDGYFKGSLMNPQIFVYQLRYRTLRGDWEIISGEITLIL